MRKILIVEDEKMIRYGIYVMIEESGVSCREITECRNGKEALGFLEKDRYDLVLTDVRMPVMNGLELAEWIFENMEEESRPLIVAISGYAEFEYAKGMMRYKAMDYLLKPVDRKELNRVLWNAEEIFRARGGGGGAENPEDTQITLTSVSKNKMQKAVDYIRKNYGNPIDMAEVSNYVSMNYSMFSSTFKEYTGENFSTYLKKLRIEKSRRLLGNTDMNINEIAGKVGFEDARHFGKVFKEMTGITPTACREDARQKK